MIPYLLTGPPKSIVNCLINLGLQKKLKNTSATRILKNGQEFKFLAIREKRDSEGIQIISPIHFISLAQDITEETSITNALIYIHPSSKEELQPIFKRFDSKYEVKITSLESGLSRFEFMGRESQNVLRSVLEPLEPS
jgi:hypothetical protein